MKTISLFALLCASVALAGDRSDDGFITIAKFELSAKPVEGRYAPWRDQKSQHKYYAGEIITITNGSFHYMTFSDNFDPKHPRPEYSGPLKVSTNHVYLDHPGLLSPYRVAGKADGVPVLVKWEGYEQWKKDKKIFELNVLWFWKDDREKAKKTVQPKGPNSSAPIRH